MDFKAFGGDKRDRTADLLNAIQALSQYMRVHTPSQPGLESALQYTGQQMCYSGYIWATNL